jgi:hypothetical protein
MVAAPYPAQRKCYARIWIKESAKAAEKLDFPVALLLRVRSLQTDNVSRERQALAAFRLAAHARINVAWPLLPGARGFAKFLFTDGIADADYHRFGQ